MNEYENLNGTFKITKNYYIHLNVAGEAVGNYY